MTHQQASDYPVETWRRNIRADVFANYHLSMGVAILHQEGPQTALRWFEAAAGHSALDAARVCATVEALRALGRGEEADRLHAAALSEDPHYMAAGLAVLARMYREAALMDLDAVAEIHRRAVAAAEATGDRVGADAVRMELAAHLLPAGRTAEAAELWRAVGRYPAEAGPIDRRELDARTAFAFAVLQRGDAPFALEIARSALPRLGPSPDPHTTGHLIRTVLHGSRQCGDEVQAEVVRTLVPLVAAASFDHPALREQVCVQAARQGMWDEAMGLAEMVVAQSPGSVQAALTLGRALLYRRQAVRAIEVLGRCRAEAPLDPDLTVLLFIALLADDRADQAAELLPEAVEAGLDRQSVAFYRALALLAGDRLKEAEEALRDALRIQPSLSVASAVLGVVASLRGDLAGALALHRDAGNNDFAHVLHAFSLYHAGRRADAIPPLQAALAARPRRVWFLAKHLPRQFGVIAEAFRSIGYDVLGD